MEKIEKQFDAVAYMRQQRDKLSNNYFIPYFLTIGYSFLSVLFLVKRETISE